MRIVIIDYGLCNLLSVHNALACWGVDAQVTSQPQDLLDADAVILPGVGAFKDGMEGLRRHGFIDPLKAYVQTGRPLLGICLGMQMLMDRSHEFGDHHGLGLIAGEVLPVDHTGIDGRPLKIPHIGWNGLLSAGRPWDGTLLAGLKEGEEMYFVHSFRVVPQDKSNALAVTEYGGKYFCSVVVKGNIVGCQFHPEKSAAMGLVILKNFVNQARTGATYGAV